MKFTDISAMSTEVPVVVESLNNQVDVSTSAPKCLKNGVISPLHPVMRTWQAFVVWTIVLSVIIDMFMAAFTSQVLTLWILVYFCDAVFIINIILTFFTGYLDKGILVDEKRQIGIRYLRTTFVLDAISILPLDLFAFVVVGQPIWKTLTQLRTNRYIRFYKIPSFFDNREAELGSNTIIIRALKYLVLCLFTTHALTCGWFAIACEGMHAGMTRTCTDGSWAKHPSFGLNLEQADAMTTYVVSLYWAMATATSTGYGDIYPVNLNEKWYSVIGMLAGISVFFGMLLGGMTSMLTNFDTNRARYLHRLGAIKDHMQDWGVSQDLQKEVVGYYEYLWLRKKGVSTENLFSDLPMTFLAELSYTINGIIIQKAPIFKDLNPGFLRMLAMSIKPEMFLPNQIIVSRGDVAHQMFFIHRGEVEVLSEDDDDTPIAVLKSGKLFGEVSLIYSLPRTATIRAATHCDIMVLDKSDLNLVLSHYPEILPKLQVAAETRCSGADDIHDFDIPKAADDVHFKAVQAPKSDLTSDHRESHKAFAEMTADRPVANSQHKSAIHTHRRTSLSVNDELELMPISEEQGDFTDQKDTNEEGYMEYIRNTYIDPVGKFYRNWEKTVSVVAILIAFLYTYMAAFTAYSPRHGYVDSTLGIIFLVVSYLFDIILVMDIVIHFKTGIVVDTGIETDFKLIVKRYISSYRFWFDVAAAFPLEIFCLTATDENWKWVLFAFLRLNRLLKIYKVVHLTSKMEKSINVSIGNIRIFKFAFYITILSHMYACAWYIQACNSLQCVVDSWATGAGIDSATHPLTEYVLSLYWAAATMSSTGYGDISASTTLGRVIALCAMLCGLLLYGYCLAAIAATLANLDANRVNYQSHIFGVKAFMKENNLNKSIQKRVTKYLSILWQKNRGEYIPGHESIMHDMPVSLQQDIAVEDAMSTLGKIPLFLDTDETFMRRLSLKAHVYTFSPDDIVVYAGDMGREIYCVRRGTLEIMSDDLETCLAVISTGQYFGEIGMIFGDPRMATVRAKTYCEILVLNRKNLDEVLEDFPLIADQFTKAEKNKERLLNVQKRLNLEMIHSNQKITSMIDIVRKEEREHKKQASKVTFNKHKEDYITPFQQLNILSRTLSCMLMRHILLPTGKFLKRWEIMRTLIVIILAFTIPIQAAFKHTSTTLWIINYIFDIIAYIDLYIGFHTSYYNEEHVLVAHPLSTSKHYFKSLFTLDLIACFPIEVFALAACPNFSSECLHLLALCRLNRLIQVYRIPLAFNYIESSVEKDTGNIRSGKFLVYILIFLNWLTCAMFMMACIPELSAVVGNYITTSGGHKCKADSWIVKSDFNIDISTVDTSVLYVMCFYWASATSVSVGYGEINAHTEIEMIVSLIIMILGVLFFGYIIASIAASLANADAQRARFQEKLDSINNFAQDTKMDSEIKDRLIKYYEYVWVRTKGVDPEKIFDGLPISLWGDVTLSLYEDLISKVSLFQNTEVGFTKMLSRCIKPMLFLKGEYVVRKFDIGSTMYFIHRGSVDVVSEDGTMIFDTMKPGRFFGEVALLFSCPRTASIRAGTNADVFVLSKKDLDEVLAFYPAIREQVLQTAEERREQAKKRSAAKINIPPPPQPKPEPPPSVHLIKPHTDSTITQEEQDEVVEAVVNITTNLPDETNNSNNNSSSNKNNNSNCWHDNMNCHYCNTDNDDDLNNNNDDSNFTEDSDGDMYNYLSANDDEDNINNNEGDDKKPDDSEVEIRQGSFARGLNNIVTRISKLNSFTINPNKTYARVHVRLISLLILITAWTITYEAAYQHHSIVFYVINYTCEAIFLYDIFINCHMSYIDTYGDMVTDFKISFKHYMRRFNGFAFDLIAIFPIDIICLAFNGDERFRILSYLRLLHIIRFYRVSQFFASWEKELNINMLMVRLLKFVMQLLLIIHVGGCVWYFIACPGGVCTAGSWAQHSDLTSPSIPPMQKYCDCVYWTVATMTSTGYGDIHAYSLLEMIFASFVMVLGKLLFGFILGNVASTLANAETQRVNYDNKLEAIKDYLVDQGVTSSLQNRVISYYDYLWTRNKGVDVKTNLMDCPEPFLAEIYLSLTKCMIDTIPMFEDAEASFSRLLSMKINTMLFVPGDCIVREGDVGSELYYIYKGEVKVTGNSCSESEYMAEGAFFGEINIIYDIPRQESVQAISHVDMFVLAKKDLDEVMHSYPIMEDKIRFSVESRFGKIMERRASTMSHLSQGKAKQKKVSRHGNTLTV
ncbi:unnamed protein product [Owenia fusiformis]|uniref:Uncharacterized protein n=1 Tax=Owenia fusiformis TaxID=6347 RepID=A0A8J1XVV0_OWEFU|nr:unnamed protein product [Owenia fusiformis]